MAGDFDISVAGFEIEDGQLVMIGTMGVWDARTYVTARDLLGVVGKLLRFSVIFYLIRVPFLALAGDPSKKKSDDTVGGKS